MDLGHQMMIVLFLIAALPALDSTTIVSGHLEIRKKSDIESTNDAVKLLKQAMQTLDVLRGSKSEERTQLKNEFIILNAKYLQIMGMPWE